MTLQILIILEAGICVKYVIPQRKSYFKSRDNYFNGFIKIKENVLYSFTRLIKKPVHM